MFSQSKTITYSDLKMGRKLGQGGFGVVYQGTFRHNDVAIKQLLMENISSEAAAEFESEAKVMAQLRSPNIVQFYGYCVSPNYCIVMEYMPNGSLFSVLRSNQPLEWPTRFRIAVDMAKGLSYLHHEAILHRDIKSLNVLLDSHYQAKLTDFGLSKVKAETKSHTMATKTKSDSVGTIAWMAPELFSRKATFTQKSDIYSLGITFWELAARKIPFSDAASQELIPGWVKEGEREDIPADCPAALSALIQACWTGEPSTRPEADDVVTRLKGAVEALSIPASVPHYRGNFNSAQPSIPQYQGNFGSEAGPARAPAPQVLPPRPAPAAVSPAPIVRQVPPVRSPVAAPTPQLAQLAIAPQVDANAVKKLLKLVAEGEQDEAEKMLKATPALALAANDVTDLSNRTFKNITAFQYAVWALDWHMWTMIQKYLPLDAARDQIQTMATGSWVSEHGKSASWQNLLDALQKYIDLCNKLQWEEAETQWQEQVGGAQRLLPAHVINEYCHPTRAFAPCPDFTSAAPLPRTRKIGQGEWFTASYNNGKLGESFGIYRYSYPASPHQPTAREWSGAQPCGTADHKACLALFSTRVQQRDELVAQYSQTQRPGPARK